MTTNYRPKGMTRAGILVVMSTVLSVSALGAVVWRATCSTCGDDVDAYEPVERWTDDENAKGEFLWNDIYRPMVRSGAISDGDVEALRQHTLPVETYWTRQLAFGIMAECLDREVQMSKASRDAVVQTHLVLLSDADGHLRLASVAQCHGSGLLEYPRVREAVRALAFDANDIIASRVEQIDWSEYESGGGLGEMP